MTVTYPARLDLARTPTSLVHLDRTSSVLGVELYLKRDDLTGSELSGNKVRKLEFLLAEAIAHGADTLITCGGEQSNHARATAMAAARVGLGSHLILRTEDPARPPATAGNILLDRLAGATIRWIPRSAWVDRNALMEEEAGFLRAAGRRPYIIPEGGSSALGAWGYVRCAEELGHDLAALPELDTTILYACGSGGTGAGLELGVRLHGLSARGIRVAGVNVCDDRDYFVRVIGGLCAEFEERFATGTTVAAKDIAIIDGYVGLGYARSRDEELLLLAALARREGVVLDPVYTGKAFFGLVSELARDPACLGRRVVFLHTGGIFGLFPAAERLAPLL